MLTTTLPLSAASFSCAVVAAESHAPAGSMRDQADKIRDKLQSGVVVLIGADGDKVRVLVGVTKDIAGKKVHAGKLAGEVAALVGGKGGGTPDFAQAGGTDRSGIPAALARAVSRVGEMTA